MPELVNVYIFRDKSFAPEGNTVVCLTERLVVEAVLNPGRLEMLFGGAAVYTNDRLKLDYIGVWGARNASRFRTLLRSYGLDITINRARPPEVRLRYHSHGRRTNGSSTTL